jgi:D-threo-aldose 1-dehydrogenase
MYEEAPEAMLRQAHQMEAACARYQVPLAAAALQFSLRDPRIASTVVGISRAERLSATVALAQHAIPDDLWTELETIFQS